MFHNFTSFLVVSQKSSHIVNGPVFLGYFLAKHHRVQIQIDSLFPSFPSLPPPSLSSQSVSEDLMGFVKDLWRQNSSLVDALEKSKKRQLTEKKRMKQELVSLMNQIHHQGSSAPTNEVDFNDQPSIINPRRACAARVTVVGFVCLSVCLLLSISLLECLFVSQRIRPA